MSDRHLAYWPKNVPRHLVVPETNVFYNLEVSAHRHPKKPYLIYYDTSITFPELQDEAERMAGFLERECGVKKGDRVLLFMQNSPQFVIAYYAIMRANAVVVPINTMNLTNELRQYVVDSGADPGVALWSDAMARNLRPGPITARPDDLCVMPYTSGTTGSPKGCMHTHRTVMYTLVAGVHWFGPDASQSTLAVLPFFHVTGMQGSMNGTIYSGNTIVLLPRWDREVAAQLIQRYRITGWQCIPTMVVDFLANPKVFDYDLKSLERLSGGGAAEEAVPRHTDFRRRRARGRSGNLPRAAPRRGRRNHRQRAASSARLLEQSESDGGSVRRDRRQAFPPHRRSRAHRRGRLLLPGRSAEAHDQCLGLQGLAGGSGELAVSASGRAGGVRHRSARFAPRRNGESGGRAEARCARQSIGTGHHRLGVERNGRVQVSAHRRVRRCAAEIGHRQSAVAPAARAGKQQAGERLAPARPSGRANYPSPRRTAPSA